MPSIYAHTNDGYVGRHNQSSWSNARANSTGTISSSTTSGHSAGMQSSLVSVKGGGTAYTIFRTFLYFDTSGISSNVDSATLKIHGFFRNTGDIIVLKSTSNIGTLGTADFEEIAGWDSSGTDGSGGADMESSVTKYSSEITSWSTTGYNDITLNAQALADMRDDSYLYVALVNFDHDLKDVEPTGLNQNGLYYLNQSGADKDPYVDYTLAAVTATDNAVFFGTNF